jgi:hypothetical protein
MNESAASKESNAMNANMNPGARIPRNALQCWQSDKTIASLSGEALTKSLRDAVLDHMLRHSVEAESNLVHPADWPERAGYEALRETAEELRRHAVAELSAQFNRVTGLACAYGCADFVALDDLCPTCRGLVAA